MHCRTYCHVEGAMLKPASWKTINLWNKIACEQEAQTIKSLWPLTSNDAITSFLVPRLRPPTQITGTRKSTQAWKNWALLWQRRQKLRGKTPSRCWIQTCLHQRQHAPLLNSQVAVENRTQPVAHILNDQQQQHLRRLINALCTNLEGDSKFDFVFIAGTNNHPMSLIIRMHSLWIIFAGDAKKGLIMISGSFLQKIAAVLQKTAACHDPRWRALGFFQIACVLSGKKHMRETWSQQQGNK